MARRRRLRQVHAHDRLRRRAAVRLASARWAPRRRRRSTPRRASACAGSQGVEPGDGRTRTAGGIGSGNKRRHVPGDHDLWRLPQGDDALAGARESVPRAPPGLPRQRPRARRCRRTSPGASPRRSPSPPRSTPSAIRPEPGASCDGGARSSPRPRRPGAGPTSSRPSPTPSTPSHRGATTWSSGRPSSRSPARRSRPAHRRWLRAGKSWARVPRARGGRATPSTSTTRARSRTPTSCARCARPAVSGLACTTAWSTISARSWRARARAGRPVRGGCDVRRLRRRPAHVRLVATALLYRALTATPAYDAFATAQRDWALGANAVGRVAHDRRRAATSRTAPSTWSRTSRAPGRHAAVLRRGRRQRPERRAACSRTASTTSSRTARPARRRRRRAEARSTATGAATWTTSAHGRRSSPRSTSTPPRRSRSRSRPRRPEPPQAAWSSEPCKRTRRRRIAFVWSWETRDSVTLSTSPISRNVSSS